MVFLFVQSKNCIELLGNGLAAFILNDLDNMGSIIVMNWVKSNYYKLTTRDDYMVIKSCPKIESYLISIYIIGFSGFVYSLSTGFALTTKTTTDVTENDIFLSMLYQFIIILVISAMIVAIYNCHKKWALSKVDNDNETSFTSRVAPQLNSQEVEE